MYKIYRKVNKNTRINEGFLNRFNYYILKTDMNTTVYRKCILKGEGKCCETFDTNANTFKS